MPNPLLEAYTGASGLDPEQARRMMLGQALMGASAGMLGGGQQPWWQGLGQGLQGAQLGMMQGMQNLGTLAALSKSQEQAELERRNIESQIALREAQTEKAKRPPVDPRMREWEARRGTLEAQGYTPEQINEFMVNRDRYSGTTDMFGNRTIFDKYSGQFVTPKAPQTILNQPGGPMGGAALPPGVGVAPPQTGMAPPVEAPRTGQTSAAAAPAPGTPTATAPAPSAGYEAATGGSGFFGNLANMVTDAFGLPLAAPQTEKAIDSMKKLAGQTELLLTTAVPGRDSNQVRQRLRADFAVEPASIFMGDERAQNRLRGTREFIAREHSRLENMLANPVGLKATDLAAARSNWEQLGNLLRSYDQIVGGFEAQALPTAGAPAVGHREGDYEFMGGNHRDKANWRKWR